MSNPAEIPVPISQTLSPDSSHVPSLTCPLYLSFIPFLTALSPSPADIRPIRALRHRSPPLQDRPFATARSFLILSLSLSTTDRYTQSHRQYLPQYPLSPWPYLLYTTLSGTNVSDSSFQRSSQCQIKTKTAGRVESLYVLGTGTFDVTTWETTASLLQLFPCFLQLLLTWISRTRQYHSDHRSPPKRRSYIEETLSPNN